MGVYADKYFGYIMDVTKEYDAAQSNLWEEYIDGKIGNPELLELGFVPYYSRIEQKENDITLLYDGMSGEYAKLVLIQTVEKYADDDSEPNEKVNNALKLVPVPTEIKEKLEKAYEIIFGKSENYPVVHLMQFTHFH